MSLAKAVKSSRDAHARHTNRSPERVYVASETGGSLVGDDILANQIKALQSEINNFVTTRLLEGENITITDNLDGTYIISAVGGGGGGGASSFIELEDTPSSYTGQKGKMLVVNPTEDSLVFTNVPSGGGGGNTVIVEGDLYQFIYNENTGQFELVKVEEEGMFYDLGDNGFSESPIEVEV